MQRVDQPGRGDDRGAVLIVVEHRDVEQLAQPLLDDEALRRLDVFEIDAAEGRVQIAHAVDELVDVAGVDLEIDRIDVGKALEQRRLALHDRLRRERAEIAEAEHRGAVRDHRDEIALRGVVEGGARIALRCAGRERPRPANRRATGRAGSSAAWSARSTSLPGRPLEWNSRASSSVARMVPVSMLQGAPRPVGRRIRRARGLLASINLRIASGSVKAGARRQRPRRERMRLKSPAGSRLLLRVIELAATTRSPLRRPSARGRRRSLRRSPLARPDRPDRAQMITEFGEERQRRLVLDYFGGEARLRIMRRAPTFGSPVFVVDFDRGAAPFPHPGLVRQQRSGDRAVEHGPDVSGAPGLSLRAADVAGVGDEPAGGQRLAARRRRGGDVALYARLSAGLRRRPWSMPTRPSSPSPAAGST